MKKRYKIYPSLLNDFYNYLTSKGETETTDAWVTEEKLLSRINREDRTVSEKMVLGILFEDAVFDRSIPIDENSDGELAYTLSGQKEGVFAKADCKVEVLQVAKRLYLGGMTQVLVSSIMEFPNYDVELYGKIDVVKQSTAVDIKYTSRPEYAKFKDSFQHPVYLRGLKHQYGADCSFDYFVTDLTDWSLETYVYNDQEEERLREIVRRFVEYLELRRPMIRDKKVYAEI